MRLGFQKALQLLGVYLGETVECKATVWVGRGVPRPPVLRRVGRMRAPGLQNILRNAFNPLPTELFQLFGRDFLAINYRLHSKNCQQRKDNKESLFNAHWLGNMALPYAHIGHIAQDAQRFQYHYFITIVRALGPR